MANRFWVGGTGTWNASNTTNWAATSNGAGGQSVPGPADTVTFDANSGSSFTVTVDTGYNPSVTSVTGGAATVTLDLNSQTLTAQTFNFSGAAVGAVRTLAFGATGQIIITGNNATVFTTQIDNNLSLSGSRNVVFTYSGGTGIRSIGTGTLATIATTSLNYYVQGGTDTVTFTGPSGIVFRDLDFTGFSGTLSSNPIRAYGNFTLSSTMTIAGSGNLCTFQGPSGGTQTLTTAGLTLPVLININTPGGTVVFADDVTIPVTLSLILSAGTLNLNNRTVNVGRFSSSGSVARTLAFVTSSTLNITGNAATILDFSIITNFTLTGVVVFSFTYAGAVGSRTIIAGAFTESQSFDMIINSGTDSVQVTGSVKNLNTTGFSGTFLGGLRTIFGNLTIAATTTLQSSASATTFAATSGTKTITTSGKTMDFPVTFNGVGGTWQFQDNVVTIGTTITGITNLLAGTLNLNAKTVNLFALNTNSASVRGIIGTGATLNLVGNNTTIAVFATTTNLTLTGLPTINCTYSGSVGTRTITGGAFTEAASFNLRITGGTDTINLSGSYRTLDMTGFGGILGNSSKSLFGNYILNAGMTVADGAAFTSLQATSGTFDIDLKGVAHPQSITVSGVGGTYRQLGNVNLSGRNAVLNGGTWDLNNFTLTAFLLNTTTTSVKSIAFGTTGVMNLTANNTTVWSFSNATGFSFTGNAVVNFTYAGAVGTRTITHGSAAGGSLATKAPPMYITAGTDQVAVTATGWLGDLNFNGFAGTLTNTSRNIAGNLTFSAGMIASAGANATTFNSNVGTQTITTNGITTDFPITISSTGGNFVLGEPLVLGTTRLLTVNSGNLIANGYSITAGTFDSNNTNTRIINISNVTVNLAAAGTVWNTSTVTGANLIAANSNINLSNTSTASRLFAGGGLTYGNLNIGGATGANTLMTFTGNNIFAGTLTSSKTVAHTVQFTAGTTTTVGGFGISGSAGNEVTITSATQAQHNLVLADGSTVNVSYANIRYSNASPANTWYALLTNNNTDSGNNSGWIFATVANSNFFLVF